ncbi:hypothetical protein [Roseibium sp. RKSG952]|nr:hypothetical protein [Roseibium sp. RKSG952]
MTEIGNVHAIVDKDSTIRVVAVGWLRLSWTSRDKENPVSFG